MFYIVAAAVTLFIIFCGREKKSVKTAATAVFTGTASLIAAHFIGMSFGINISVNLFTSLLSACGGIPFVLLLVLWTLNS